MGGTVWGLYELDGFFLGVVYFERGGVGVTGFGMPLADFWKSIDRYHHRCSCLYRYLAVESIESIAFAEIQGRHYATGRLIDFFPRCLCLP